MIFWFCGASMQAVTTGRLPRGRVHQEEHGPRQEGSRPRGLQDGRQDLHPVCPERMWNIFIALMTITLAFAIIDPNFFLAYLISIAASDSSRPSTWPTPAAHGTTPRKSSRSTSRRKDGASCRNSHRRHGWRPFQGHLFGLDEPDHQVLTLFGLLATEIAIAMAVDAKEASSTNYAPYIAIPLFIVGLIFVWRSFYKMRIPIEPAAEKLPTAEVKIAHVHD